MNFVKGSPKYNEMKWRLVPLCFSIYYYNMGLTMNCSGPEVFPHIAQILEFILLVGLENRPKQSSRFYAIFHAYCDLICVNISIWPLIVQWNIRFTPLPESYDGQSKRWQSETWREGAKHPDFRSDIFFAWHHTTLGKTCVQNLL